MPLFVAAHRLRVAALSIITTAALSLPLFAVASAETAATATESQDEPTMRELFDRALASAELLPEQQVEVDALRKAAEVRHQPIRRARRALGLAIADALDHHQLDRCALIPEVGQLVSAMARSHSQDTQALMKLHAIMTPEQRDRFATTLHQEITSAEERAHDPERVTRKLGQKLDFTDAQYPKVKNTLISLMAIQKEQPGFEERKTRWKKFIETFKGESFDPEQVAPSSSFAGRIEGVVTGHLWAMEPLVSLLTDKQKEVLAAAIREKIEQRERAQTSGAGEALMPNEP